MGGETIYFIVTRRTGKSFKSVYLDRMGQVFFYVSIYRIFMSSIYYMQWRSGISLTLLRYSNNNINRNLVFNLLPMYHKTFQQVEKTYWDLCTERIPTTLLLYAVLEFENTVILVETDYFKFTRDPAWVCK